ncbi:MAG: CapA family protein [Dermatophilaceae bacterium]
MFLPPSRRHRRPPTQTPALPTPSTPPTAGGGTRPITLAFAGDIHFERHVRALLDRADSLAELRPSLGSADVTVVNLESAITTRGTPEAKEFHFRTTPAALGVLASAGVDVVSLANNHAVDYGPVGLTDTLAAKAASPVPLIGIGQRAAEAFAPAVLTVRGTSIAVIAATQVNDLTVNKYPATDRSAGVAGNLRNDRLVAAVTAARGRYDVVVVFLHWGTEKQTCPDAAQQATAAALENAGADVIVGGHAHRVQGAGWLGRSYVGYGLGNFIWWLNSRTPGDVTSGVLTVSIDPAIVRARAHQRAGASGTSSGTSSVSSSVSSSVTSGPVVTSAAWTPLTISAGDGIPRPPAPAERPVATAAWNDARTCTNLRSKP